MSRTNTGLVVALVLAALAGKVSSIDIDERNIITICNASKILWSRGNETEQMCSHDPLFSKAENSFENPVKWEFQSEECNNNTVTDDEQESFINRSIMQVKYLIDFIKDQLFALIDMLRFAAQEISQLNAVLDKFSLKFYLIAAGATSGLFIAQGMLVKRRGKQRYDILTNLLIGTILSLALYTAHLFYEAPMWTYVFIGLSMLAYTPIYAKSPLGAIGILTTINLIVPLIGFIVQRTFETSLLFGPVASTVFNIFIITNQVLCLIGLYIDEKLTIFKMLLTPFAQMLGGLSKQNADINQSLSPLADGATSVTNNLVNKLIDRNGTIIFDSKEGLAGIFNLALETRCNNSAREFEAMCPSSVTQACTAYLGSLTGFAGFITTVVDYFGQTHTVCSWIANTTCTVIEFGSCKPGSQGYDVADRYFSLMDTTKQFTDNFMMKSLVPPINDTLFNTLRDLDLLNNSLYWYLLHGISMFLGCFFIGIIIYSMIAGARFLRKYNTNVRYYNTYLSPMIIKERNLKLTQREKRRYYDTPSRLATNYFYSLLASPHEVGSSISLILQSLLALVVERLAKLLHSEVSKIQFKVNTYGDSNFLFNVDGDGIFAHIFQLVLGAFNVRTRFCGTSSTKNCEGPFIENSWRTWLLLFCLAIGYFLVGVVKQKATYIMCHVCDFINPEQADKRANHCLRILEMERQLMGFITDKFAQETIDSIVAHPIKVDSDDEKWSNEDEDSDEEDPTIYYNILKNEKIMRFYRNRRPYYRYLPLFVWNMIAFFRYRVVDINCQICAQNLICARYRCNTILFCDECRNHLTHCPCRQSDCGSLTPVPI